MAVVNTKSTTITNADASPAVHTPGNKAGNKKRFHGETAEIAAGDDDTSVVRLVRVHTSDVLSALKLSNDAISGSTDIDVGLYDTAANGGAVIDADCYADGIALTSAGANTDLTFSARAIEKIGQQVWQDAGLTSDPKKFVDVCLTGNTIGTAAGTVSLEAETVTNN